MDIEDLEVKTKTLTPRYVYESIEAYEKRRHTEDSAIAKLTCPDCGYGLRAEPSMVERGFSYYVCMNPTKELGHIFIR